MEHIEKGVLIDENLRKALWEVVGTRGAKPKKLWRKLNKIAGYDCKNPKTEVRLRKACRHPEDRYPNDYKKKSLRNHLAHGIILTGQKELKKFINENYSDIYVRHFGLLN